MRKYWREKSVCIVLLLAISCLCTESGYAINGNVVVQSRYILVLRMTDFKYYIDRETVKMTKDPYGIEELAEVWIQVVATKTGSEQVYNERLSRRKDAEGYENYSYSMQKYLIKLDQRKVQKVCFVDFDKNGATLETSEFKYDSNGWEEVIPSTVGEKWYNAAVALVVQNIAVQ